MEQTLMSDGQVCEVNVFSLAIFFLTTRQKTNNEKKELDRPSFLEVQGIPEDKHKVLE